VFAETLILLTSSFTCGLAIVALHHKKVSQTLSFFTITFVLGVAFLGIELNEFHSLLAEGNSWSRSGFLSAFFTLVGTHGLHITAGLLWMMLLMIDLVYNGITEINTRRLILVSLFWHFLDVVWIGIFSIVYLLGLLQ
jgi:cytochrome o ubiquinol oxidase subunit 3